MGGGRRDGACLAAGVEPQTDQYEGDDPLGYVVSLNLHRRHLNESQRGMVAARIAGYQHGGDRKSRDQATNLSLETAAEKLKVGEVTARSARKVLDSGDDALVTAVERGEGTTHIRPAPAYILHV